nr:hypothetical protein [Tanacetum cinerariifolium]
MVQDVEETLRKLKRVNIKIDPVTSPFRVKEGRFLGCMQVHPKACGAEYPIRKAQIRLETVKESGWTNKAEKALRRIKRKVGKLQTLAVPKEGEDLMLCPQQRKETISSVLLTTRSLREIFRKHKVKVVIDGPMEEMLQLSKKEGQLAKWAIEIRTYEILSSQERRLKDQLYMGKETIKEGSCMGIILVSPKERMHSYAIRLKFNTSDHAIDCKALLVGLAVSVCKGMKDLHIFIDLPRLVAQIEGNHMPATKQEKKYKKEIMDATTPFHRFRITHLPKILNSKAEVLTGLETIKLKLLNQEVSVGIKTRPLAEETSNNKKGKATSNVPSAKPNYNWEVGGSNLGNF